MSAASGESEVQAVDIAPIKHHVYERSQRGVYQQCVYQANNSLMHASFERLFNFAVTGTAGTRAAVTDKAGLARLLNVSDQTVNNWATRGVSKQGAIAAQSALGCNVAWIIDGNGLPTAGRDGGALTDGKPVIALDAEDSIPDGMVLIKESRVRFSGGHGHKTPHYEEIEDSLPAAYRRTWFSSEGMNPTRVRRFIVTGKSMETTLFNGDTILVNLGETDVKDGQVYAIRYGDELRVKRLFRRLDGGLVLASDNPEYPREELPPDVVDEHVSVIGRVREKAGKGGL